VVSLLSSDLASKTSFIRCFKWSVFTGIFTSNDSSLT
jgi:hypothetical protein